MKIALAGLAGVAAAWLLPRGGVTPEPTPSLSPSDRPGVTAVQLTLASIPSGVSFRVIDGTRVFLVRTGNQVVAFEGHATVTGAPPIWWCPRNNWFEGSQGPYYSSKGITMRYSSQRNLDRVQLQINGDSVTLFPHALSRGGASPPTPQPPPTLPRPQLCSVSERVG